MNRPEKSIERISFTLVLLLTCNAVVAQAAATLRGQVTDQLGGAIVDATVTLIDANNHRFSNRRTELQTSYIASLDWVQQARQPR